MKASPLFNNKISVIYFGIKVLNWNPNGRGIMETVEKIAVGAVILLSVGVIILLYEEFISSAGLSNLFEPGPEILTDQ